jgi:hypothetical protein
MKEMNSLILQTGMSVRQRGLGLTSLVWMAVVALALVLAYVSVDQVSAFGDHAARALLAWLP